METGLITSLLLIIFIAGLRPSACEQQSSTPEQPPQTQKEKLETQKYQEPEPQKQGDEKSSDESQHPGFRFIMDADFRITVAGYYSECFFVDIEPKTTLFVNFQVMSGGDRLIDLYVKDTITDVLVSPKTADTESGYVQHKFKDKATAKICLVNIKSINSKVVALSIFRTFVMEESSEDTAFFKTVNNFTKQFDKIFMDISNITMTAKASKKHAFRDYVLMLNNRKYVKMWAIVHIILIVASALLQTFFLRHFFKEPVNRKTRV